MTSGINFHQNLSNALETRNQNNLKQVTNAKGLTARPKNQELAVQSQQAADLKEFLPGFNFPEVESFHPPIEIDNFRDIIKRDGYAFDIFTPLDNIQFLPSPQKLDDSFDFDDPVLRLIVPI
ncbi:hypothetical protein Ciccas_000973 [Cichlidogyrus casuarinus]|uniref:Uncharacterized protein n=1 Tax=Cichlidogyrus casuarinus TaxID=1844966 RepID=A0ABD2QLC4_9PLAT